ncbi:MAG: TolC family protein [Flaviaesturariibacter sp.]|nr:TolC family protein [Flaviaesturariibacter sp.]
MNKLLIGACSLLLCVSASAQEAWDLRRSVDYALANNISVKQQDIQARLARLTYDQSKLSQYPNLNFSTNFGLNTGRSIDRTTNQFTTATIFYNTFGLQTGVDVFNFGTKKNTIAAYRLESEAALASVDKLKNDIALNVAGTYLQVLLAKQQVDLSRIKLRQTEAQLANTRKLVNAGSVPELNAAQLEAQLAQDSSNVVTAKAGEIQALYLMKALLALDAAVPFDVVTPPVGLIPVEPLADLQPALVYQMALQNLPQQRVNSLRLQAANKNVEVARGSMYPSLSANAALQTNYSNSKNQAELLGLTPNGFTPIGVVKGTSDTVLAPRFNQNYRFFSTPYGTQLNNNLSKGIGFGINVPIFNGGSARTAWQRAKLNVKTFELQQQLDTMTLKQDIYKAYTDAITAMEKFNASTKAVETSAKAFDFAQKRYNIGLLSTIEYLTTQSNLFSAQLSRSLAQFEYVFKMKVLEFYKGQGLKL